MSESEGSRIKSSHITTALNQVGQTFTSAAQLLGLINDHVKSIEAKNFKLEEENKALRRDLRELICLSKAVVESEVVKNADFIGYSEAYANLATQIKKYLTTRGDT